MKAGGSYFEGTAIAESTNGLTHEFWYNSCYSQCNSRVSWVELS